MELNAMKNLIQLPAYENVIKRYGKYTRKVNGELVKSMYDKAFDEREKRSCLIDSVVYDWFERDDSNQYKLSLTKGQYDQMKAIVSPIDANGDPLTLDRFFDVLIPVITAGENDHHDDYSIWLVFRSFKKSNDRYIQAHHFETLIHTIAKSVGREQIRYFMDKIDWDHDGQLDFNEFRQFIIRGYARELLMTDITRETVYSMDRSGTPTMTHQFC